MDYFATDQCNYFNNIYNMECNEPDPYFWEYEQYIYSLMAEAIQSVMAEYQRKLDAYSEIISESGETQLALINQISENVSKSHDRVKEFSKEAEVETFQDEDLEESFEDDPNDTTYWTIGHEHDKNENTPNKSSHETIVQDAQVYILTKVKKEEHRDQLLETHKLKHKLKLEFLNFQRYGGQCS